MAFLSEADPAIGQIGARVLHRQQYRSNLAIVERGQEFERFRAIALRGLIDREQPGFIAAERGDQRIAGRVHAARRSCLGIGCGRRCRGPVEKAHPPLEGAPDQGEEQVVGIEPALRQPRAPDFIEPREKASGNSASNWGSIARRTT